MRLAPFFVLVTLGASTLPALAGPPAPTVFVYEPVTSTEAVIYETAIDAQGARYGLVWDELSWTTRRGSVHFLFFDGLETHRLSLQTSGFFGVSIDSEGTYHAMLSQDLRKPTSVLEVYSHDGTEWKVTNLTRPDWVDVGRARSYTRDGVPYIMVVAYHAHRAPVHTFFRYDVPTHTWNIIAEMHEVPVSASYFAVDDDGRIHVADGWYHYLHDNGTWTRTNHGIDAWSTLSIDVDHNGDYHLAYNDAQFRLHYNQPTPTGRLDRLIPHPLMGSVRSHPVLLRLDQDDHAHIIAGPASTFPGLTYPTYVRITPNGIAITELTNVQGFPDSWLAFPDGKNPIIALPDNADVRLSPNPGPTNTVLLARAIETLPTTLTGTLDAALP